MRKRLALGLALLLLAGAAGCSADPAGQKIKAVFKDQAVLINLLKKIKTKDSVAQLSDEEHTLKEHIEDDLKALGDLEPTLSDEEKLRLQLKYGPPIESMYIVLNQEVKRVVALVGGGGKGGGMPLGAQGEIEISPQARFLVNGYATMGNIVQRDLDEMLAIFAAVKTPVQTQEALSKLRKLRHRLSMDVVKLEHVVPKRKNVKEEIQAALKGALQARISSLNREEERVRAISGGPDLVTAVEPLPKQLTTLAGS